MIEKNLKYIKWWFSPKFPEDHVKKVLSYHPIGKGSYLRDKYRTWMVHPIKRRIAKYYLNLLRKIFGLKVIGITGSAGKTTTKDMVTSILRLDGETVSSFENIDPVYNIPTTILKCNPATKYLILEMGVEYPNEMDFYLWLAKPDIGVITNIFPTHTEFFKSVGGVFKEKSKLVTNLNFNDWAVLNLKDKKLKSLRDTLEAKTIFFGEGGDIKLSSVKTNSKGFSEIVISFVYLREGKIKVNLPLIGPPFAENALASAAVADILGISLLKIKKGLETVEVSKHRMNIVKIKDTIIMDDSYNNNPQAAIEAIKVFNEYSGKRKKIVVFGDMLELGKLEKKYHRKLGKVLSSSKLNYLIGVGRASEELVREASKGMGDSKVRHVNNWQEAYLLLRKKIRSNQAILIKGSRSIGLDNIVSRLSA